MMEGLKGSVAEHEAFTEQELRAHRTGEGEEKEWRSSLLKLSSFIITQTWKAHIWLRINPNPSAARCSDWEVRVKEAAGFLVSIFAFSHTNIV